jgi:fibrillarin-like rRNA methylase
MNVIQGTDFPMILELLTDANTPLKPSDLFDYNIIIYTNISDLKEAKVIFKKADITVIDDALGEVGIILSRTYTSTAKPVKHYLEFKYKTTASSEYLSALRASGVTDKEICTIIPSAKGSI